MPRKDIIVIGASAGGVEACKKLVSSLPKDFEGSIFIVIHLPSDGVSVLPQILSHWSAIPAVHPRDGAIIKPGLIYVAPPDHHMLIKPGRIILVAGPEENYARPAVDPLFRSASAAYGRRVVGVVLSGNLDDGTAGLEMIKKRGGTTVVQNPEEAHFPDMPRSAINRVEIDHILPLDQIGGLIATLARTEVTQSLNPGKEETKDILEMSIDELQKRVESGASTGLTCPECGGILREKVEGDTADFRCRVGHAFSSGHLESALSHATESALWNAVRVLEEKEQLCHKLADRMSRLKSMASANHFESRGKKASEDARIIRKLILESESKRGEEGNG